MVDTMFMLGMQYRRPVVTLAQVVADYLPHLTLDQANRKAAKQSLPFPVFRGEGSQKSTWLVNVTDVANWLDQCRETAVKDWEALHT